MNLPLWNYMPAAALIVMGALFAWIERRTGAGRELLPVAVREIALNRSRRRVRIAALLIFVGVLMGCGIATDPHRHPVRYVSIWGLTALLAVSMLCYGIYDFYATRVLWVERMRQSAGNLGEAARRARAAMPGSTEPQLPTENDGHPPAAGGN
jgi:hypothetical protein